MQANFPSNKCRVVIVGLDGASPHLISKMIEEGFLPSLSRVIRDGYWGSIMASIPDVTPPSWTSMVTGVDPSKHGIFDFFKFEGGRLKRIVTSNDRKFPALWDTLSRTGKRVIVVNVPVTYPPRPVKGILISDMLTPEGATNIVYPDFLSAAIKAKGYEVGIRWTGGDGVSKKVSSKELASYATRRFEVFNWLISEFPWDFSMVVFNETDFAQHLFPDSEEKLIEVYSEIDRGLGNLINKIDLSNTTLLVVSDHGFRPARRAFRVNDWLMQIGALEIVKDDKRRLENARTRSFIRSIVSLLLKSRTAGKLLERAREYLPSKFYTVFSPTSDFDSLSGLYCPIPQPHAYVSLSLAAKDGNPDYEEIFRRVKSAASELVDNKIGASPIKEVIRRSEVYRGIYSIDGPALLLLLKENYVVSEKIFQTKDFFYDTLQGIHEPNGIIADFGGSVKKKEKRKKREQQESNRGEFIPQISAKVWDITPTVLDILGIPVEKGLDGRVIEEIVMDDAELTLSSSYLDRSTTSPDSLAKPVVNLSLKID